MAVYSYRALTPSGSQSDGDIEASDQRAAIKALQAKGLLPIEAVLKSTTPFGQPLFQNKVRAKRSSPALNVFTRELATLIRAGEPLERAIALIAEETGDKSLTEAIGRALTTVRGGRSLAEALEAEPEHFSRTYVGMVSAGEATGQLHAALDQTASLAEHQEETRRKFLSAITYPCILMVVAVLAVGFMLGFVVPQFAPLLEGHEAKLPPATIFVLEMARYVKEYGQLFLVIIALFVVFIVACARVQRARQFVDAALLKAGWFSRFSKEHLTAQLARSLGTLLSAGLELPASLAMSAEMLDNSAARVSISRVRSRVREGQRLADALNTENILVPIGQRLFRTGEESGRLAEISLYLADQMDRRIANRTARFLSILEPVLVVVLGIVVGGITVAILSAMLSVNELTL